MVARDFGAWSAAIEGGIRRGSGDLRMIRGLTPLLLALLLCPAPAVAGGLDVVTYNVWHGLGRMSGVRLRELEAAQRREHRFQWLVQELLATRPDLIMLQEVNPVAEYTRRLLEALPGYDEVHQADNCGFKIAGAGIPSNFHQGLTILARAELGLERVGYERLSGDARCSDHFGRQTTETHIVLAARVVWKGKRILVLNTHLYGEPATTPFLRGHLASVRVRHRIARDEWESIVFHLDEGTRRRAREVERLAAWARQRTADYDGIILGGDLNAEPDAKVLRPLRELGLVDAVRHLDAGVATFDYARNPDNIALEALDWSTKDLEGLSLPESVERQIREAFELEFYRPKRIDYVFVSRSLADLLRDGRAYMTRPSPNGYLASDHLGLLVRLLGPETSIPLSAHPRE